jgi:hypothetical protein
MIARDQGASSVWAAEHGASSLQTSDPEGANVGHRFRIHGRLGRQMPEQLRPGEPENRWQQGADAGERLRETLAQATEIDLRDVHITVGDAEVELSGTLADDGERRQLEDLVARMIDGKRIISQLRPRNP